MVDLLQPQVGELILDLGCGTGDLTAYIHAKGCDILGVDAAAEMIAAAQVKFPEIRFEQGDVLALDQIRGGRHFDAVFSNAMLHWVTQPASALEQIADSLNPGGRLVLEMGAVRNIDTIYRGITETRAKFGLPVVQSPWYFPTLSAYCTLVEACGLRVQQALHFARPTPLESKNGMRYWLEMFAGSFMQDLNEEGRCRLLVEVERSVRDRLFRDGRWWVDYWRLQLVAYRD